VRSGSGVTSDGGTPIGSGNLIVGYNAARAVDSSKVGSHNLVVGDNHNFSSYGGMLGGFENAVTGPWSTASGGQNNVADAQAASVMGGRFVRALADWSTGVGGGGGNATVGNTAWARFTTIVGGQLNQVGDTNNPDNGRGATGVGGTENHALGNFGVVVGGFSNTASGDSATVIGGESNQAQGSRAVVGGGSNNSASGQTSVVNGGSLNIANAESSAVSGGRYNVASGDWSSVSGGGGIFQGDGNRAESRFSSISAGRSNRAGEFANPFETEGASVAGGRSNVATGQYSNISGGQGNFSTGHQSAISGGANNQAAGLFSTITGGNGNSSSGDWLANPGSDLESRADVLETGVQGYERVITLGESCLDAFELVSVSCPAGKKAVGGSCWSNSAMTDIWSSLPISDGSGWQCGHQCNGVDPISKIGAAAVCADAP
jgi:hypothetical protein